MSKPLREKLQRVGTITTRLIPVVEGFTFVEFTRGYPGVVMWVIAGPSY